MSELKVNKISPRSGTDITLGDSGDTFTLGSGANIAGLTLSDNILFDTASKGIYLGVTSATASNLLDDYEEGTWTPTLETGTITLDAAGYYTKIGRLVYINFIAGGFSDTSSSNSVKIDNLPFTNSSFVGNNDNYGYVMSRYLNISDQSITSFITGGDSTMTFYINGNAGAGDNWITVKHNQIGSGAYFRVGAVYLTDA
jgi:hypothetical protein